MKNIIDCRRPFPFNLFQKEDNVTYRMECKTCNWQKLYRVFRGTVLYAPGVTPADNVVKAKSELPKACPQCGGSVKKHKLPSFIKY